MSELFLPGASPQTACVCRCGRVGPAATIGRHGMPFGTATYAVRAARKQGWKCDFEGGVLVERCPKCVKRNGGSR